MLVAILAAETVAVCSTDNSVAVCEAWLAVSVDCSKAAADTIMAVAAATVVATAVAALLQQADATSL
jgi:hypothetical protein